MVSVNKEKCIGCGLCVSICEEVFEMTSDGKAKVKSQKNLPCVRESIQSCPVNAIEE